MRKIHALVFSAALALLSLGAASCGGSSDSDATGSWVLDKEAFLEEALPILKAAGKIPAGADSIARQQLGKIQFRMELKSDGNFVCDMGLGSTDRFTGTWAQGGTFISLLQTEKNGEAEDDTMKGHVDGNTMRLEHMEEGMKFYYHLRRSESASPR